ncbi:hypothetical protein C8R47DRAFT_1068745 [Mycena vitilis]|nr:hypothetical protein C8R47DRAFT_1068745 [Mycena vitilis]
MTSIDSIFIDDSRRRQRDEAEEDIYRHLLDYPSSAFRGLFSLPRGAKGEREGEDDSRPICPDDIRSFFHYAYSPPLALQYPSFSFTAPPQLMGTLRFAHKYRPDAFEKWASKAITEICSGREALKTCGLDLYIALLELDRLCSLPTVKGLIQRCWVSRLRENKASLS